jgi:hypothetical protein
MLRYAGRLASEKGEADLYPLARALEIDEACGFVGDLERSWRAPVGIGIDPTDYGYPAGFKGSIEVSIIFLGFLFLNSVCLVIYIHLSLISMLPW